MSVEQQRPRGRGNLQLSVDEGIAGSFEQFGGKSASFEHRAQVIRVAADVLPIRGDVWNGEQLDELTDDLSLVRGDPAARADLRR